MKALITALLLSLALAGAAQAQQRPAPQELIVCGWDEVFILDLRDIAQPHPIDPIDLEHADRVTAIASAGFDVRSLPAAKGQRGRPVDQARVELFREEQHPGFLPIYGARKAG